MVQVIAHDFETTGVNAATCGVVQSAILIANIHEDGSYEVVAEEDRMHNPGCPIPDGASAVHGIRNHMVDHLPNFADSLEETYEQAVTEFQPVMVIGYNSNHFDNVIARRVGMPNTLRELDLMIAARRLMARGVLARARLVDAYEGLTGLPPRNAHNAAADVYMTLDLIQPAMRLFNIPTFEAFCEYLSKPVVLLDMVMPYGKHKGVALRNVPKSYRSWLLEKANDTSDDMTVTLQYLKDVETAERLAALQAVTQ